MGISKRSSRPMSMPKIKVLGPTVTAGQAVTDGQTDGNVGNIYELRKQFHVFRVYA